MTREASTLTYLIQRLRRARDDERHSWARDYYTPRVLRADFDREVDALAHARSLWEEGDYCDAYGVWKHTDETGLFPRSSWAAGRFERVPAKQYSEVHSGELDTYVLEEEERIYYRYEDAVFEARRSWDRTGGRVGYLILEEELTPREIARRRLARMRGEG